MGEFSDNMAIFNQFEDMVEVENREDIVRAPFGYPGGKSRSINHILPHLPYRKSYIEPFGGSGAILLARREVDLEVLNDRYMGVCVFYRCMRDPVKYKQLQGRLELVIHSREEFNWCKQTWQEVNDEVERAARWYYMLQSSFANLGRNFARATNCRAQIGNKLHENIKDFDFVHQRLKKVQVENQDWRLCVKDYDNEDAVFYLDPPYFEYTGGIYKHLFSKSDHSQLLNTIFDMKGFVAISGYANALYDSYKWDHRYTWDQFVSITSLAKTESNFLIERPMERGEVKEVLWIKESN